MAGVQLATTGDGETGKSCQATVVTPNLSESCPPATCAVAILLRHAHQVSTLNKTEDRWIENRERVKQAEDIVLN